MWNAMGTPELMARKVDVLRAHCDAVGRDIADIEFTLGIKATIRDTEAEADRVWKAAMAHNRTPLAEVADDDTFWNGTPRDRGPAAAGRRPRLPDVVSEQPAPRRDAERFIGEVVLLIAVSDSRPSRFGLGRR
jgi:alkanesulfonate monooxygenase SsuD/methylene tetrahydromethanopterin reductase-like flavin-dependent oxidoreductase (luciferase family)